MSRFGRKINIFVSVFILSVAILIFSLAGYFNNLNPYIKNLIIYPSRIDVSFLVGEKKDRVKSLEKENIELRSKLVKLIDIQKDNLALRDQFMTATPRAATLLPAYVVSSRTPLPGISVVDKIVIGKGSIDKIKKGQKVVYKDNLIGFIDKTSIILSEVKLLNNKDISITAESTVSGGIGILAGTGGHNMVFEKVSLTHVLSKGDTIITRDSPPLIAGKIISIDKKSSSIFQSAEVKSLIDTAKLKMVFILVE